MRDIITTQWQFDKYFKLIYPRGGEHLTKGETYKVRWLSKGILIFNLYYSEDQGNTWNELALGIEGNEYDWKIIQDLTTHGLIKIET